jgi:hypothetical protein
MISLGVRDLHGESIGNPTANRVPGACPGFANKRTLP